MGVKDGVDAAKVRSERLLAKIGRSVDEKALSPPLDQNRTAGAGIARIRGAADGAGAPE
jgi:hypothetical protein